MSEIIVKCPHCGGQFTASQEWIGQTANCPACGNPFTIAAELPPPAAPAPTPAAPFGNAMPQPQPAQAPNAMPYAQQAAPQGGMPYGQQPQYGTPVQPPWTLTDPQARSINGITKLYIAGFYCLIGGLAPFLLGELLAAIGAGAETQALTWIGIGIQVLAQPPLHAGSIMSMVALMILTYKYWQLVPPQEAETTPGKAIGFLFIPFFNLYWMFVAFWQLSQHYDRFAPPERRTATLALLSVIFYLAGFLTCGLTSIAGLIMQFLWVSRMKQIALSFPRVG